MIYNPPVLVPDPNGSVEIARTNRVTGVTTTDHYREDTREALFQTLEQIIGVNIRNFGSDRIVAAEVGSTTSTFYPDGNPEVSSVDGVAYRNAGFPGESWSTIINGRELTQLTSTLP